MRRALIAAAVVGALAGTAAAHPVIENDWWRERPPPVEIVQPPPPPPPAEPDEPRERWFGFRFGMLNTGVAGHDRVGGTFGLQWGTGLIGELRGFADYELVVLFGSQGDTGQEVWGRGHALRLGLRYPLADYTANRGHPDELRMYADLEASGGALYTSDNLLGAHVTPQATGGLRLGYQIRRRDADDGPARPRFDGHLLFRAVATASDLGVMFGVGMEWGS